jgi:hypothetical protein
MDANNKIEAEAVTTSRPVCTEPTFPCFYRGPTTQTAVQQIALKSMPKPASKPAPSLRPKCTEPTFPCFYRGPAK